MTRSLLVRRNPFTKSRSSKPAANVSNDALSDTKQFNNVTQLSTAMQSGMPPGAAPTQISREAGGAFSLFGGHIVGRHIELVPNERIVPSLACGHLGSGRRPARENT